MCPFFISSRSSIRENTIASLKDAVKHGADIVEFDVQVSMDLIPVIYHNFELYTSIVKKRKKKRSSGSDSAAIDEEVLKEEEEKALVKMPLKNLTLDQLQSLKVTF